MIQFMKAMRDERGEMVRNAHILGFSRRICKPLFLRTKPVFVFDGATPALKRRTVIARRRQRENAQTKIRKTAEKLLLNHLKAMRLKELAYDLENQRKNNGHKGKRVISDKADLAGTTSKTNPSDTKDFDQEALDAMLAASIEAEEGDHGTPSKLTAIGGEECKINHHSILQNNNTHTLDANRRAKLAVMHVRSLFSEKVIDVIKANTVDLGPLSFDSFRKNNLSASWKFSVQEDLIPHEIVETDKKRTPRGQEDKTFDGGQSQTVDTTAKLARRVKVQEAGTDWGWGVVVTVVKKPAPPLGSLPPGLSSSRDSSYIVDTLLHYSIVCADSSLSNLLIIHSFPNSNALPLVNN